jgi:cytochrome c1
LHEHLEQVNATATKIRQASKGDSEPADGDVAPPSSDAKLQDIVKYLRREQDILTLQLVRLHRPSDDLG